MSNTARICQVHEAGDPVPGRTCGRAMPCRVHGPRAVAPAMVPCEACAHYHQTDAQVVVCQRREIRKLREELRREIGGGA